MKEQEQIEEIRALMKLLDKCVSLNPMCKAEVATVVYGNNYRKINEDSIVLSREKYEMLANQYKNIEIKYSNLCDNYRLCKDANETLKQHIIVTCKKTAEKILNDLVKNCQYTFSIDGKPIVELDGDFVLNAAKSYGIEIKE